MVWAAALALLWQAAGEEAPAWHSTTPTGSIYYVMAGDVAQEARPYGTVSIWLRGLHQGDKTVDYRKSIWKIHLDCAGHFSVLAFSKYGANGMATEESDRYSGPFSIRPETMYVSLERQFCPNKK